MQLHKTSIAEHGDKMLVELLIADKAEPEMASESLLIRIELAIASEHAPRLALIQRAALQRAREIIAEQIRATQDTLNQVED